MDSSFQKEGSVKLPENDEQTDLNDILSKNCRDISDKVINTKVLLREIDHKINDLQKWREERKAEFDQKIAENKRMANLKKSNSSSEEDAANEEKSYEKYIQKLEEMMKLYAEGISESIKLGQDSNKGYSIVMQNIEKQLSEREGKLKELSLQLTMTENFDNKAGQEAQKLLSDFDKLKDSMELWRRDYSDSIRNTNLVEYETKKEEMKESDMKSLKALIENEKKNKTEVKKYDFKDDLDEIDNDLKELEELLGTKI